MAAFATQDAEFVRPLLNRRCRSQNDLRRLFEVRHLRSCGRRDAATTKYKRRHLRTHSKMKELVALAAGLPTIFHDRENVAAGGFASYRPCQLHTSWK
jgi:hypothetical protein